MLRVLLILFVIFVALLIAAYIVCGDKPRDVKVGGSSPLSDNDIDRVVVSDAYSELIAVVESIGTSKYVIEHIESILGKSPKTKSSAKSMDRDKVRDLLADAQSSIKASSAHELIIALGLRYDVCVSPDVRKILSNASRFVESPDVVVQRLLRKHNRGESLTKESHEQLVRILSKVASQCKKFAGSVSNKKPAELRAMNIAVDTLPLVGLVDFAICTRAPKSSESIQQRLDAVNLIEMYIKEPSAVRSFIERVRREIRAIDYNTTGRTTLSQDELEIANRRLNDTNERLIRELRELQYSMRTKNETPAPPPQNPAFAPSAPPMSFTPSAPPMSFTPTPPESVAGEVFQLPALASSRD